MAGHPEWLGVGMKDSVRREKRQILNAVEGVCSDLGIGEYIHNICCRLVLDTWYILFDSWHETFYNP